MAKTEGLEKRGTHVRERQSSRLHRIPIILPEEQYAFLLEIGLKSLTSGGKRLSHSAIVRAALAYIAGLDLDLAGVQDETDLKDRIVKALKVKRSSS